MKLPEKSAKQEKIDIQDYYALKLKALWSGFKQEGAAFTWLCIYFFFEYVRPQSIYPVIDILPWSQLSLLLAIFTAFADKNIKWVSNAGNFLLIFFLFVVLVSSVLAFRPANSFDKIDIFIGWVILYFLIITVVNTEKRFIIFVLLFLFANFKMSQFGARDFLIGGYKKVGVSGAPGWFKDAGDLGIEMSIYVSLATAFVFALKENWGLYKKLFFYLLPFTGLITIIATSSRGAQLGMAAAGCWILIASRKVKVLLWVLVLGALVYVALPQEMMGEFEEAGEDSTSQTRLALWEWGGDVIADHPFLGVGYYNWLSHCWFENPDGPPGAKRCLVAHNSYVTVAAETGLIGLACYLLIILFILMQNSRTRVNARKISNKFILFSAYGLDAGLISYSIATIFFTETWYPMLYVQLSMTVALNEISKKQLQDKDKEVRSEKVRINMMSAREERL